MTLEIPGGKYRLELNHVGRGQALCELQDQGRTLAARILVMENELIELYEFIGRCSELRTPPDVAVLLNSNDSKYMVTLERTPEDRLEILLPVVQ